MPGIVTRLPLAPSAFVTAVSIGRDGRVWFAFIRNGPGPGVGSFDQDGNIDVTQLDPVSYGYGIGDLAIDAHHGIWATALCFPARPHCASGYARFGGDHGPLSRIEPLATSNPMPFGIAADGDGGVWIADRNDDAVVHVTADGRQRVIRSPEAGFKPYAAVPDGQGGAFFNGAEPGKILAVNRAGRLRWIVLPDRTMHASSFDHGDDGTIWVADSPDDQIVAIDPHGRAKRYAVPTANAGPTAMNVDRHGNAWSLEHDGQKLGRVKADGTVSDAYLPLDVGYPDFLVIAPNDTLVVVGHRKGLFNATSWTIGRIVESSSGL